MQFAKKIFIPFDRFANIGGPTTFMKNLQVYLEQVNFLYVKKPYFARGIFFPIAYNLSTIKWIKFFGGKVIQRLDGIYYPSKHGENYLKQNKMIKKIYSDFTDFVVFQSEYSRKQCFAMFGEKKRENYEIIVNGVNEKIFYPSTKKILVPEKFILTTTGNFRNVDMLEPIILALDGLADKINFEFWIIGPLNNPALEKYAGRKYVKNLGSKNMEGIAELLRKSDIFIYSHLNPPCPNSVLEAIASGLPVVGFDSGSMPELLNFNKDLLAYVSDEIFQKYEDFDSKRLADKIELAISQYERYKKISLENSQSYSFEKCGKKYTEVFEKIVK